ncbi:MAG TPA: hypothetical protein VM370_11725 [Candidatus Thermoplasmatota archaeon]|nr:hypothetical protein [Candidatus Thermoplasmatota archaeon]
MLRTPLVTVILALTLTGCTDTHDATNGLAARGEPLYEGTLALRPGSVASADVQVPANVTSADLTFRITGAVTGLSWAIAGCSGSTGGLQVGQSNEVNGRCGPLSVGAQTFELRPTQGTGSGSVRATIVAHIQS